MESPAVNFSFPVAFLPVSGIIVSVPGVWRSLVARSAGGREVAGSNPVTPIYDIEKVRILRSWPFLCNRKFLWNSLLHKKYYRTAAEWNNVAKATRRRRRILRCRILYASNA